jgi:hypothetical protein
MLHERHAARVRVADFLLFRTDFSGDKESPVVRAVVVMFEDVSACAAGIFSLLSSLKHICMCI